MAAALLGGVLSAAFVAGCRAPARSRGQVVSSLSLSGVVKSIDATTLVVTRSGKNRSEMTFALIPATNREGVIRVGATVQVRFRTDGGTHTATAIVALPPPERQSREEAP